MIENECSQNFFNLKYGSQILDEVQTRLEFKKWAKWSEVTMKRQAKEERLYLKINFDDQLTVSKLLHSTHQTIIYIWGIESLKMKKSMIASVFSMILCVFK